ncbi:MAG: FAD binding domain-containing protein [Pseudomonadota bacterium]
MGSYLRPAELGHALAALASAPRAILAGGTDYYPARVGKPSDEDVLDITAIAALEGIEEHAEGWRIAALARWSDLIARPLPPLFDGLKLAAREVGGVQIQNAATICGNLCNASPAADGVPNLLALDAAVELASLAGRRVVGVAEFIAGNRRTTRRPHELVTAILIPRPRHPARATFLKLGARKYLVISIVMVAVAIEIAEARVAAARIAVGACSEVARRLPGLEAAVVGRRLDAELAQAVGAPHLGALSPIDDLRATAAYRRDATLTLLRRALAALAGP